MSRNFYENEGRFLGACIGLFEKGTADMVRAGGLEPPLLYRKRILSPQRLPIPPRPQQISFYKQGTISASVNWKKFVSACTVCTHYQGMAADSPLS